MIVSFVDLEEISKGCNLYVYRINDKVVLGRDWSNDIRNEFIEAHIIVDNDYNALVNKIKIELKLSRFVDGYKIRVLRTLLKRLENNGVYLDKKRNSVLPRPFIFSLVREKMPLSIERILSKYKFDYDKKILKEFINNYSDYGMSFITVMRNISKHSLSEVICYISGSFAFDETFNLLKDTYALDNSLYTYGSLIRKFNLGEERSIVSDETKNKIIIPYLRNKFPNGITIDSTLSQTDYDIFYHYYSHRDRHFLKDFFGKVNINDIEILRILLRCKINLDGFNVCFDTMSNALKQETFDVQLDIVEFIKQYFYLENSDFKGTFEPHSSIINFLTNTLFYGKGELKYIKN